MQWEWEFCLCALAYSHDSNITLLWLMAYFILLHVITLPFITAVYLCLCALYVCMYKYIHTYIHTISIYPSMRFCTEGLLKYLYSQLSSDLRSRETWPFLNKLSNTPRYSGIVKKAISLPRQHLLFQAHFGKSFRVPINLCLLHKEAWRMGEEKALTTGSGGSAQ